MLFTALLLGLLLVYYPAYRSGFIADFLGMYFYIDDLGFIDFLNRSNAEVKSFYQVTQFQLYLLIKLFGLQPLPWFILFMVLHALIGILLYTFFLHLFRDFGLKKGRIIALAGVLLFLFNPNITEIIVWKGCYHYLTGILMQFGILWWTRQYLVNGGKKYVRYTFLVFLFSLFTLEIFYLTPFFTLLLIMAYSRKNIADTVKKTNALKYLLLPQAGLFAAHLLLFRIVYGSWIAHYGVTNALILKPEEMLPRISKYLAYLLLMAAHVPEKLKVPLYDSAQQPIVYYSICSALVVVCMIIALRFRKLRPAAQLTGILLPALIGCLILISPIYFDDHFSMYNSRRCYQAGIFTYMLLPLLISGFSGNKDWAKVLFFCYCSASLVFTIRKTKDWGTAADIQYGILSNFSFEQNDPVLLLNLPSYYRDIRIMPANRFNEFNKQLQLFERDTIKGQLYEVSSYNMLQHWDGAHVTVLDSMTVKVTLNQWGSWWMYDYLGAGSYENELYTVDMTDMGHEYILRLKRSPGNMVLLFQKGLQWKKVNLAQPGEQW